MEKERKESNFTLMSTFAKTVLKFGGEKLLIRANVFLNLVSLSCQRL